MDKTPMVIPDLEQARLAVKALVHAGLPMTIALAIRDAASRPWILLIATPDVAKHGPLKVIRFADEILKAGSTPFTIDDAYLVAPNDSRAQDAMSRFGSHTRQRLDEPPKSITIRFDDEIPQTAYVLTLDRSVRPSDKPLVVNKAAIERAWAA